jgi:hypothetical protein
MDEKMFYLVWNPFGHSPSFRHATYDSALKESRRLAQENPCATFYVLAAMSKSKNVSVQTVELERELPF